MVKRRKQRRKQPVRSKVDHVKARNDLIVLSYMADSLTGKLGVFAEAAADDKTPMFITWFLSQLCLLLPNLQQLVLEYRRLCSTQRTCAVLTDQIVNDVIAPLTLTIKNMTSVDLLTDDLPDETVCKLYRLRVIEVVKAWKARAEALRISIELELKKHPKSLTPCCIRYDAKRSTVRSK